MKNAESSSTNDTTNATNVKQFTYCKTSLKNVMKESDELLTYKELANKLRHNVNKFAINSLLLNEVKVITLRDDKYLTEIRRII